jgi:hypothetical protein
MEKLVKILVNAGLSLFFICTSVLVIIYVGLLWEKITRPHYKNMNWEEAKYFGLIALAFAILDILIVRRLVKLLRKANR